MPSTFHSANFAAMGNCFADWSREFIGLFRSKSPEIAKYHGFNRDNPKIPEIERFIKSCGITITHKFCPGYEQYKTGYYHQVKDYIFMPSINTFRNSHEYYRNLFHEIGHWTGYKTRLKRAMQGSLILGLIPDAIYAKEEAVAEIASFFLTKLFNLEIDRTRFARYVKDYVYVCPNQESCVRYGIEEAIKAVNFLANKNNKA